MMKKTMTALLVSALAFNAVAEVTVTEENYSEAMFNLASEKEAKNGARQDWHHHRSPIALDKQPAPMMNRDTLYSFVVADARSDIKVTIPEMDGRYLSVQVMNMNHETVTVFYGSGEHIIKADETTDYVTFYARTQVDATNKDDIKKVNAYQDQFHFEYLDSSFKPTPFSVTPWDMKTFMPIHKKFIAIAQEQGIASAMSDLENDVIVDQQARNRGVSIATGLLPDSHATYKNGEYSLDKNACYTATYSVPAQAEPDLGFYSITIYDDKQYLATDENAIVTNSDITFNADDSFTVNYGNKESCGDVENLLHIPTDTFSINMRIYLPDMAKIDAYKLPELKLVK